MTKGTVSLYEKGCSSATIINKFVIAHCRAQGEYREPVVCRTRPRFHSPDPRINRRGHADAGKANISSAFRCYLVVRSRVSIHKAMMTLAWAEHCAAAMPFRPAGHPHHAIADGKREIIGKSRRDREKAVKIAANGTKNRHKAQGNARGQSRAFPLASGPLPVLPLSSHVWRPRWHHAEALAGACGSTVARWSSGVACWWPVVPVEWRRRAPPNRQILWRSGYL